MISITNSITRSSLLLFTLVLPSFGHQDEAQKLLASDASGNDAFGRSVAVDDETILVGAPNKDGHGAAYVFVFDEHAGRWIEEAKLVAGDAAAGDEFGFSVAVHGNLALVGAPGRDQGAVDAGAVYVFARVGSTWTAEATLTASRQNVSDGFGVSVALDGSRAVIGAPRATAPVPAVGRAIVFARDSGAWTQQSVLVGADGTPGNQFGKSVSIMANTVAVGAPLANGATTRSGAAYVFKSAESTWTQETKLIDAQGLESDFFGLSLDLGSEWLLVVGAPGDDDNGSGSGSTFTYRGSDLGWEVTRQRVGSGAGDRSGGAVSHSFRTTLIGARFDDDGAADGGNVAIHITFAQREASSVLGASDATPNALLGSSVAAGPCWHVAGAHGDRERGIDAGAAYAYVLRGKAETVNGTGINTVCATTVSPPNIGTTWEIMVDDGLGEGLPRFSQVFVRDELLAHPMVFRAGELLIDPRSRNIAQSGLFGTGPMLHQFRIPNDPGIIGYTVAMQAAVYGMMKSRPMPMLCNAELAQVGCLDPVEAHEEEHPGGHEE